jgi:hypothetical protein
VSLLTANPCYLRHNLGWTEQLQFHDLRPHSFALRFHSTPSTSLTTLHYRLLSHTIETRVLDPAHVPTILRSLRRTFFPANTFPRQPKSLPDEAAITAIKQQCTQAILGAIPAPLRATYLCTRDPAAQMAAVESWLDVLSDPYLNKHLIFSLLELCVVRLIPELASEGPKELLTQRTGLDVHL